MRRWLVVAILCVLPARMMSDQSKMNVVPGAVNRHDLTPLYLPLIKRANGRIGVKPVSFNTF